LSDIVSLAHELVRLGTKCVFGIPGEGPSLFLLDELEKRGCAFHLVSHEAAGALAAGGFGHVAGIPGVSLSIKGPGFCNMLAGIASNWLDRNPALSISESYGPDSSSHRLHKRVNHGAMVEPVVKAYADNVAPDFLPKLWDICLAEEPGPVHLDISHQLKRTFLKSNVQKQPARDFLLAPICQRIRNASRPIVIAGGLATRRTWRNKLAELKIPVFTTFAGKGSFDETLPYSAGVFTNSGGRYAPENTMMPTADLVVGLGLRTTEILDVKPLPVPLILVDELTGTGKGLHAADEMTGGTEAFLEVLEVLKGKEWGLANLIAAKNTLNSRFVTDRWLPPAAFRISQRSLPKSTLFFLDTGDFSTVGEHVLIAQCPLRVMGSAMARSMGVGIPTGIGAALAAPDTPIVIITGDGGMRMYPDTITIAVRHRLPVVVLLMTDSGFSSVRRSARREDLSQNCLTVDSSYWTKVLYAWGCPAERIESLTGLEYALQSWNVSKGPLFLALVFKPDDYLAVTEGIR
jgi:acetolactate synthase-1/2/3 large subunit